MAEKDTLTFTVNFFKPVGKWYTEENIVIEAPRDCNNYELRELIYEALNNMHPTLHAIIIDERIWFPLMRCAKQ